MSTDGYVYEPGRFNGWRDLFDGECDGGGDGGDDGTRDFYGSYIGILEVHPDTPTPPAEVEA
jgi:hypothetical protein